MYIRSEENTGGNSGNNLYDFINIWSVSKKEETAIIAIDVNQSEEYLIASCKNHTMYLTHIKSIMNSESTDIIIDQISQGNHSGPIVSMDVAVQRPILVTVSTEDCTLRLWNYHTNTCVLAKRFTVMDESYSNKTTKALLCAAIHPQGYYLAVGLLDRIRIYHILHNGLKPFKLIDCINTYKIKFSNGG